MCDGISSTEKTSKLQQASPTLRSDLQTQKPGESKTMKLFFEAGTKLTLHVCFSFNLSAPQLSGPR